VPLLVTLPRHALRLPWRLPLLSVKAVKARLPAGSAASTLQPRRDSSEGAREWRVQAPGANQARTDSSGRWVCVHKTVGA
jgi:hypothetical protein